MHALWSARSPAVCLVWFGGGEKGCCAECHSTFEKDKPSRTKCWRCRTQIPHPQQPTLDPLAQIGQKRMPTHECSPCALASPRPSAALSRVLKKCSNTEICVIPHIDRDPLLKPDPLPLVHIKRQHRFDYENGKCYCAELSEGAEKKLFSFLLR